MTQSPLKLLCAGAYEAPQGRHYPFHIHNHWELVFYRDGFIQAPVGKDIYNVRPGLMLLTPPNTPHAEVAHTRYANYFLMIEAPADIEWPQMVYDDSHSFLSHICRALADEWNNDRFEKTEMISTLVSQLAIWLRRAHLNQAVSVAEKLVREAEKLMEERLATSLSLSSIAGELGVAPSTLRAHFVALRGQPPTSTLQSIRVRRALQLLSDTDWKLQTIADCCGYYSPSHLSRQVKALTGQAPGQWRADTPQNLQI